MKSTTRRVSGRQIIGLTLLAFVVAAVGFSVAVWGCGNNSYSNPTGYNPPPPSKNNQPNTVVISGYAFSPASITVAKGTTITWQNNDPVVHTATADNGSWDTGAIAAGASKTATFASTGTFTYHCTQHPMMTATVVVQ